MLALAAAIEEHAPRRSPRSSRSTTASRSGSPSTSTSTAPSGTCATSPAGRRKIEGGVLPVTAPNMLCYTRREPVGVCAQIIPWNFPLLMAAWKIGPALAAGCTIVLKPAEQTPLSALRARRAGARGRLSAGRAERADRRRRAPARRSSITPDIDKIAFTGSTAVGREIGAKAGTGAQARDARARAASRRTSSCPTPTSTRPSRAPSRRSTSTPGRPATPARACSSRQSASTR